MSKKIRVGRSLLIYLFFLIFILYFPWFYQETQQMRCLHELYNEKVPFWGYLLTIQNACLAQNQNSLLVKRQNDNTSPGDRSRKISPKAFHRMNLNQNKCLNSKHDSESGKNLSKLPQTG